MNMPPLRLVSVFLKSIADFLNNARVIEQITYEIAYLSGIQYSMNFMKNNTGER